MTYPLTKWSITLAWLVLALVMYSIGFSSGATLVVLGGIAAEAMFWFQLLRKNRPPSP